MAPLPRCIIFDLDGTLLDSIPGIEFSAREAFAAAGLAADRLDLRRRIGPPIRTILGAAAGTDDPAQLDRLERGFRASYDSEGWRRTPCFPGVAQMLDRLRTSGRRLFVASNKPRHISQRILEDHGIAGCFDEIVTRDSAQPPYPSKAAILASILSRHSLQPGDCVMVGDTIEDAEAAAYHGMGFIFMEHGYGELPAAHPALLRLDTFSDLPENLP